MQRRWHLPRRGIWTSRLRNFCKVRLGGARVGFAAEQVDRLACGCAKATIVGSTSRKASTNTYCSAVRLHPHMAELVKRFRTSAMASSPVAGRSIRCLRRYASALAPSAARSARPATALSRKAVPTACAAALTSAKSVSRDTAANSAGSAVQEGLAIPPLAGGVSTDTFADLFGLCRGCRPNRLIYSHWLVWLGGEDPGVHTRPMFVPVPLCVLCVPAPLVSFYRSR